MLVDAICIVFFSIHPNVLKSAPFRRSEEPMQIEIRYAALHVILPYSFVLGLLVPSHSFDGFEGDQKLLAWTLWVT